MASNNTIRQHLTSCMSSVTQLVDLRACYVLHGRDPSEEEMQLGDEIAALQRRVEEGEADQPRSAPKSAQPKPEADSESAESPEVAPRDSEDGTTTAPAAPTPISYAAVAKPAGEQEEQEEVPQQTVQQALDELETQLAKLTVELDDKVRFSKGHTGERESRWK